MTKEQVLEILHGDYMEALAYFAALLAGNETEEAVDALDTTVWAMVAEDGEAQDNWLVVYSGLLCAC